MAKLMIPTFVAFSIPNSWDSFFPTLIIPRCAPDAGAHTAVFCYCSGRKPARCTGPFQFVIVLIHFLSPSVSGFVRRCNPKVTLLLSAGGRLPRRLSLSIAAARYRGIYNCVSGTTLAGGVARHRPFPWAAAGAMLAEIVAVGWLQRLCQPDVSAVRRLSAG